MKLGDIKAQALLLMGFDEPVNAENVSDYEYDDNWAPLLRQIWIAVNRCLVDLASKRALPLAKTALMPQKSGAVCRFDLSAVNGEPERLIEECGSHYNGDMPFAFEGGDTLLIMGGVHGATYTLIYRPAPELITEGTSNTHEITLPQALEQAVVYFVKSEVYRFDEPAEAAEARNFYEAMVEQHLATAERSVQGCVDTVFGVE